MPWVAGFGREAGRQNPAFGVVPPPNSGTVDITKYDGLPPLPQLPARDVSVVSLEKRYIIICVPGTQP